MNTEKKSIVTINKRINFKFSDFTIPLLSFIKFPIFISALLNRIASLQSLYSLNSVVRVFDLSMDKAKAKKELKNKGGIYIL